MATINGTAGNDTVNGTAQADLLNGLTGNDRLIGGNGPDTLAGGDGNDTLDGGNGNDVLAPGAGADVINPGAGLDIITGSVGALSGDTVNGFGFGDELRISGLNASSRVDLSGSTLSIDINGDGAAEGTLTLNGEGSAIAVEPFGGSGTLRVYYTGALAADVGSPVRSRVDVERIGDFLTSDNSIQLTNVDYTGALNAVALLPSGLQFTDGETIVGIDRGIFLSTGGGPGTQNTSTSTTRDNDTPGDADLEAAADAAGIVITGSADAAFVTFSFAAQNPTATPSIRFSVIFGSDEFPEFVDSNFVDIGAILVNGVNYALFNGDPGQPLAIVGESIQTEGNFINNQNGTFNTEYDGFSRKLTIIAPVQAGINTVKIGIADTSDSSLNSGLIVGDIRFSGFQDSGTFIDVDGGGASGPIAVTGSPEAVDAGKGNVTVSGSAGDFDGDVIKEFNDQDQILIAGQNGDGVTVQINPGSAIVSIDIDGDGTPDSTFELEGDFTGATFNITPSGDGLQITTTGSKNGVGQSGTDGNDVITGTVGPDTIDGLGGDDFIDGLEGDDLLIGGSGKDSILGRGGNDVLIGGDGGDNIAASDGNDSVTGGQGRDLLGGGNGNDTIFGGVGNDVIGGGNGNDYISGDEDKDVASGGFGNDTVVGGTGDDTLAGSFDDDIVDGGAGNDSIGGGTGRDNIHGRAGNDVIGAGDQADIVFGDEGNDFIGGGNGSDTLLGGAGADTLNGGRSNDDMRGGVGADTFVFLEFRAGERDRILDFQDGLDRLRLADVDGATNAARFQSLDIENALVGGKAGVSITYDGHVIEVANVNTNLLTAADFEFV